MVKPDNLPNKTLYYVKGVEKPFTNWEKAKKKGMVRAVELRFYCPWCDAPNAVVYTPPLPANIKAECTYCGKKHPITPQRSTTKQYPANHIEKTAKKLEEKRQYRISGERSNTRSPKFFRRIYRFIWTSFALVLSTLAGLSLPIFILSVVLTIPNAIVLSFVSIILIITGLYIIQNNKPSEKLFGTHLEKVSEPSALGQFGTPSKYYERGIKIRDGEQTAYIPPSTEKESDEKTTSNEKSDEDEELTVVEQYN